jgi:hypothetical protein
MKLRTSSSLGLLLLLAGAAACTTTTTTPAPRPGVAEMQGVSAPSAFSFAPPDGTHYTWTERRAFDAALLGTRVSESDHTELRWDVSMHHSTFDTVVVDQRLVQIRATHDGRSVVDDAPAGATLELVIDAGGNLQEIRGVDAVSNAIRALAKPGMDSDAARMFSPRDIRTLAATRHEMLVADVIGRPTTPGSTWIVSERDAPLRRYTVENMVPCDDGVCQLLRMHIEADAGAITKLARRLGQRYAQEQGTDPSAISVRGQRYVMWGTALVQPATMLDRGASWNESGRATVNLPDKELTLEVRASTLESFEYPIEHAVSLLPQ